MTIPDPQAAFEIFAGIRSGYVSEDRKRHVEPDPEDGPTIEERFIPDSAAAGKRYTRSYTPLTPEQEARRAQALMHQSIMKQKAENDEFDLGSAIFDGGFEVPGRGKDEDDIFPDLFQGMGGDIGGFV